jgi:hypothetical protein
MKKDPDPISAAELSRQFSGDESSTSATYGRVSSFREKLATEGLKRYEVYVSDKTKKSIKSIARQEEISTGVAAEALLKLGIEAYERLSSPQAVVDPAPFVHFVGPAIAQAQAPSLSIPLAAASADAQADTQLSLSSVLRASTVGSSLAPQSPSKGLAVYTDRTDARTNALSKQSADQVENVAMNLIAAAKRLRNKS